MKIAIFREDTTYIQPIAWLKPLKRGHKADVIDTLRCYMNISQLGPTIHYKGAELTTL